MEFTFIINDFPSGLCCICLHRAWILNFDPEAPYIYPYFFLNLDTQGIAGVIKWVLILLAGFVVTGYMFFGIDRLLKKKNK